MTHIKPTPEAEKLTAEEEAEWREIVGRRIRDGNDDYAVYSGARVGRLFATLDASRAETEAVRRERDNRKMAADAWEAIAEEGIAFRTAECNALRSLAAELVEGLMRFVTRGNGRISDIEHARALIAHAQGIGEEKEKANG